MSIPILGGPSMCPYRNLTMPSQSESEIVIVSLVSGNCTTPVVAACHSKRATMRLPERRLPSASSIVLLPARARISASARFFFGRPRGFPLWPSFHVPGLPTCLPPVYQVNLPQAGRRERRESRRSRPLLLRPLMCAGKEGNRNPALTMPMTTAARPRRYMGYTAYSHTPAPTAQVTCHSVDKSSLSAQEVAMCLLSPFPNPKSGWH